jgi:predicted RNase H-like HicB family nuclease
MKSRETALKLVYPVIITKGGKYLLVSVPDCDSDTQRKNLADAIEMARDAISIWCVCEQDAGRDLPKPSEISAVKIENGQIATLVDVDVDAYRRILDNRSEKSDYSGQAEQCCGSQYHQFFPDA